MQVAVGAVAWATSPRTAGQIPTRHPAHGSVVRGCCGSSGRTCSRSSPSPRRSRTSSDEVGGTQGGIDSDTADRHGGRRRSWSCSRSPPARGSSASRSSPSSRCRSNSTRRPRRSSQGRFLVLARLELAEPALDTERRRDRAVPAVHLGDATAVCSCSRRSESTAVIGLIVFRFDSVRFAFRRCRRYPFILYLPDPVVALLDDVLRVRQLRAAEPASARSCCRRCTRSSLSNRRSSAPKTRSTLRPAPTPLRG